MLPFVHFSSVFTSLSFEHYLICSLHILYIWTNLNFVDWFGVTQNMRPNVRRFTMFCEPLLQKKKAWTLGYQYPFSLTVLLSTIQKTKCETVRVKNGMVYLLPNEHLVVGQ